MKEETTKYDLADQFKKLKIEKINISKKSQNPSPNDGSPARLSKRANLSNQKRTEISEESDKQISLKDYYPKDYDWEFIGSNNGSKRKHPEPISEDIKLLIDMK